MPDTPPLFTLSLDRVLIYSIDTGLSLFFQENRMPVYRMAKNVSVGQAGRIMDVCLKNISRTNDWMTQNVTLSVLETAVSHAAGNTGVRYMAQERNVSAFYHYLVHGFLIDLQKGVRTHTHTLANSVHVFTTIFVVFLCLEEKEKMFFSGQH